MTEVWGATQLPTQLDRIEAMLIKLTAPKKRKVAGSKVEYPAPECVDKSMWTDFLQHRKEKKSPMKATTYAVVCAKLINWNAEGVDVNRVLLTSIQNGWTGLFKPRKDKIVEAIIHVADDKLQEWAERHPGAPMPKQQTGYDYNCYRKDLEKWYATQ